jgi:solute carrier family 25 oxoglutarate transporter 11
MYKWLYTNYKVNNNGKEPSMWVKSGYALQAGFIGSLVGNPADLALIRMQADLSLPAAERRNYTNVFNAFSRIVKEEGILALWRGSTPTIIRALVINLAMLAPFDEVKMRMN